MFQVAFIAGLSAGWAVAGIASAALPLAIHLWARRRAVAVVFPATRFVRAAQAGVTSRRRLRDLLLLFLRIAAVILLAAGFARPTWLTAEALAANPNGRALVVLLDASASMTRSADGAPLFESARRDALAALRDLDPTRDLGALIIINSDPRPVLPLMSANIPALTDAAAGAACTLERGDANSALRAAAALLESAEVGWRDRSILVLSDMQASAWRSFEGLDSAAAIRISRYGDAEPNLAVSEAGVSPARPVAGRQAALRAIVRNLSDEPRTARVRFDIDGRGVGEAAADLPAWTEREVAVPVRIDSPGWFAASAMIDGDAFAWDDRFRFGFEVVPAVRAAMITPAARAADPTSASWFIRAALNASCGAPPLTIDPVHASSAELAGVDAAVLVDAGALPDEALAALKGFCSRGGIALWVVDSPAAIESARRAEISPIILRGPALPTAPSRVRTPLGAAVAEADSNLFRALHAWNDVPVMRTAEGTLRPSAGALLETDAGPIAARAAVGRGALIMLTIDLSPGASGIVRSPLLPSLIHALLADERASGMGGHHEAVGGLIAAVAPEPARTPITDSLGRSVRVAPPTPGGLAALTIEPVAEPTIVSAIDAGGRTLAHVGINIDPDESDPRPISDQRGWTISGRDAPDAIPPAARAGIIEPRGIELWPWLIGGAMLTLILEGWLRRRARTGVRP